MGGKPKLAELLEKVDAEEKAAKKKAKKKTVKRMRKHKQDHSDSLDVEIIRKWVPLLVAMDFNRYESLKTAFPSQIKTDNQARQFAQRLITHPMFTDIIASHLDNLDSDLPQSERYVLNKLHGQAEANIMDYFKVDEHGHLVPKDLSELEVWQQQNIKKIKVRTRTRNLGLGRTHTEQELEIEIQDPHRAVALLGKNLGMFVEKVEIEFGKNTADRLEAALERAKRSQLGQDGPQQLTYESGPSRRLN